MCDIAYVGTARRTLGPVAHILRRIELLLLGLQLLYQFTLFLLYDFDDILHLFVQCLQSLDFVRLKFTLALGRRRRRLEFQRLRFQFGDLALQRGLVANHGRLNAM